MWLCCAHCHSLAGAIATAAGTPAAVAATDFAAVDCSAYSIDMLKVSLAAVLVGSDSTLLSHFCMSFLSAMIASGDIQRSWRHVLLNLASTSRFLTGDAPLSRPGAWAYPDMLEVGNLANTTE